MTEPLFRQDAYLRQAEATVVAHTPDGGIVVDRSVFYATGGGQPGDSGHIVWDGREIDIATAAKLDEAAIALIPAEPGALPPAGSVITQHLDWTRRYRHMRMHTALHLLSVVISLPVTGGSIGADKGRLDFNMPEAPSDKAGLEAQLNALIARNLPVTESWITDAELIANPGLVKTMSVKPPMGTGRVRLVRIGQGHDQVDLQPCGGTHVVNTGEIGPVRLGKVENKGQQNRRVNLLFAE